MLALETLHTALPSQPGEHYQFGLFCAYCRLTAPDTQAKECPQLTPEEQTLSYVGVGVPFRLWPAPPFSAVCLTTS